MMSEHCHGCGKTCQDGTLFCDACENAYLGTEAGMVDYIAWCNACVEAER